MKQSSLGQFIIAYRQEHALFQKDFAKLTGISQQTVSRLEGQPNYKPGIQILTKLSKGMGVPLTELLEKATNYAEN